MKVKKIIKIKKGKKLLKEFEYTIGMAKLRVLSKVSLKRPLTTKEFKEMKCLKKQFLGK